MASPLSHSAAGFTSLKAKVADLKSQIANASSQEDALAAALEAVESCMLAIKVAPSKTEKQEMRTNAQRLLDQAEEIKASDPTAWNESARRKKNEETLEKTDALARFGGLEPASEHSSQGRSGPDSSKSNHPNQSDRTRAAEVLASNLAEDGPSAASDFASRFQNNQTVMPGVAVRSNKEPVSRRALPNAEKIIIWKASKLNGFKFPPWQDVPQAKDFELSEDEQLFAENLELSLSDRQREFFSGWMRPKDALPPPSLISENGSSSEPSMEQILPMDLVQDATTDCSVVASMCTGVARAAKGYTGILSNTLFPWDHTFNRPMISPNGRYQLRLNFNGSFRRVDIDDRLPVSSNERLLHTIDRNNPTLLWPALMEKAYLKVRGGYDFAGSNSNTDLWTMLGWIPEQVFLQDTTNTDPRIVWDRMCPAWESGNVLITMGTGKMRSRDEKELGLAGQHDYAVLDFKEVSGQQLVLMKNPWKEGATWKGGIPGGTSSIHSLSNEVEDLSLGSRNEAKLLPGTFWIGWNSILQHFESVYLNWNPSLFPHRQDIHFAWDLQACRSVEGSFLKNPQISVHATNGGRLWLLLCRHFQDLSSNIGESGEFVGHMSLYLYRSNGERVYVSASPLARSPYVDSPQTLLQIEVEDATAYTAVVSEQDFPSIEHGFSLIAFSSMPVDLSVAKDRYPVTVRVKDSWTSSSAGGAFQTATFFSNPQFVLNVSRKSGIALSLSSNVPDSETASESSLTCNLKLVHSGGRRVDTLAQRDIILDSGEYKRGIAFTEINDLDPGSYTIICSTFEANQRGSFVLRAYSHDESLSLRPLPPEWAGLLPQSLTPAIFPKHTTQLVAHITVLRNVTLSIVVRPPKRHHFPQALASSSKAASPNQPIQTRSHIRVSLELGRGAGRNTFAESSPEGEYADPGPGGVGGVKVPGVNLWPEVVSRYQGDLYLVVERMAGPGAEVEREDFEVVLYCDDKPTEMILVSQWQARD